MLEFYGDPNIYSGLTVVARIYSSGTQVGSDISCTEGPLSGYYSANPTLSMTAGEYLLTFNSTGANARLLGAGLFNWDGSQEINPDQKINEMHMLEGLRQGVSLVVTPTSRTAGTGIDQTISADINGNITVTRN